MGSLAKVTLVGNSGSDAELRMTQGGQSVADFNLAVNRRGGQEGEVTDWYRINVWGKQADIAQQYVKKGIQLCVVGTLSQRRYTDKQGASRTSVEVNADTFVLVGKRDAEPVAAGAAPAAAANFDPDEIPF